MRREKRERQRRGRKTEREERKKREKFSSYLEAKLSCHSQLELLCHIAGAVGRVKVNVLALRVRTLKDNVRDDVESDGMRKRKKKASLTIVEG
jgi:hypothetical protein